MAISLSYLLMCENKVGTQVVSVKNQTCSELQTFAKLLEEAV